MRVLITGGSGFLGRALSASLCQLGHEVIIHSRDPQRQAKRHETLEVQWVAQLNDVQGDLDAVINLTGANLFALPWTAKRKATLWRSRVDHTQMLVDWMVQRPVRPAVLLSGSAIGIYGDAGDTLLTEASPVGSDWAATLVQAWEAAAQDAERAGIRTVLLRTGLVLGQGGLLQPLIPLFRFGLGGSLGRGTFWYSWIHLNDWVAATVALLGSAQAQGAYNLTAPRPVRYKAFAAALGRVLRRPVWLTPPSWALQLLLGERAQLMLASTGVLPERLQQEGFEWQYTQLDDALAAVIEGP